MSGVFHNDTFICKHMFLITPLVSSNFSCRISGFLGCSFVIAPSIFSNLHRARAKAKDWEVKQFESLWTHEQDKQDSQVKVNNV